MATLCHSLDFVCPACGAQPKEKCQLIGGAPRFESHVERKYIAKDHVLKLSSAKPPPAKKPPKR
jgi:hypothetical protein